MKWITHHRNRHKLTGCPRNVRTLQISDVHYDSTKCDRDLLDKHMKEADVVVINGDWFDLMGGKYDPRSTYGMIRPEYKNCNYLDRVIEDSYEYLKQFDIPMFIGRGNHETNILKRLHTDPIDRLVQLLKSNGNNIVAGGYSGWIVYHNSRHKSGGSVRNYVQHYHHGYGGNAPRSKGVLKVDLNMKRVPDAQLITRGHDHNKWHVPQVVERLHLGTMTTKKVQVDNLQTGSYKMMTDGFGGWEIEKGFDQPVMGGYFVDIDFGHGSKDVTATVVEAK